MTETPKKSIRDNVLSAIEAGSVTMKPRWHFVMRGILLVVGAVLLAFTLLYLISFIIFMLQQSGVWLVPGFGLRGIYVFLASLPWLLVGLSLIFIIVLQVLIRKHPFSYGRPLLYTAFGVIALAITGGVALSQTPLHASLFERTYKQHLPIAGSLYREYGIPHMKHVVAGTVTALTEGGCDLQSRHNQATKVLFTPQTQFYRGATVEVGDEIVVMGERTGNTVKAFGVRELRFGEPGRMRPGYGPQYQYGNN